MPESIYPPASQDLACKHRELAPEIQAAFHASPCSPTLRCQRRQRSLSQLRPPTSRSAPICIQGHTKAALKHGATPEEIMEVIWVATEMRAGGAYAHSAIPLTTINEEQQRHEP